jgi:hypothetical protein
VRHDRHENTNMFTILVTVCSWYVLSKSNNLTVNKWYRSTLNFVITLLYSCPYSFYRCLNFKPKHVTVLQKKNRFINRTVLRFVSSAHLVLWLATVRCVLSRCNVLTAQSCCSPADTAALLHRYALTTRLLVLAIRQINRPFLLPSCGYLRNRG